MVIQRVDHLVPHCRHNYYVLCQEIEVNKTKNLSASSYFQPCFYGPSAIAHHDSVALLSIFCLPELRLLYGFIGHVLAFYSK